MESSQRCATENELLAFAEGQLRGETQTWVERHVDGCALCAELLAEALRDDDGGLETSRAGAGRGELATAVERDLSLAPAAALRQVLVDGAEAQGLRIGRYLLLERLGQGAMGFVYTAYDPELARTIALKLIRPELDGGKTRGAARARLIREAQAAARIEHPNLVTIYEVGEADDVAYIAMEHVKGRTVRAWMRDDDGRPRPWREVLQVFAQAGEGLAAAHRGGVLHRDFKPDNILLDDEGRARVVDFGLAVGVHGDAGSTATGDADADRSQGDAIANSHSHLDLRMTLTGSVLGTPAYMAPEQHASAKVDARADQYAFAVSLYEALYGVRPFAGKNLLELLEAKRADRIHEGGRGVPGWLRAVVVRALAADPQARWPDMPAMLTALRANPTVRRVGLSVAATLALGLVAGLSWQAQQRAELEAACVAEGQAIQSLWTEAAIADMRAAFEATGLSFASDSWTRIEGHIDAWVEAYARERTALCRAGELEGGLEPAVLARARACFDERYDSLASATGEWAHADAQLVTRSPSWAADFAPLADCTDFPVLARRLAIERAEGVADDDRERLRAGWQAARSRNHDGDAEGAQRMAHELAEEAAELGALSLASMLSLTECDALIRQDKVDDAQLACERAFMQAVVGSDHEGAFHSAAALSSQASQSRQDRATAKLWLDLAEAHHTFIAAPAGQADDALARLLAARAYFAQDFGEDERAIADFRRAIAAYTQIQGEFSEMASYLWLSIAHISMGRGDMETAREAVTEAGRIREAIFGADHPTSIEVEFYRASILHELDPAAADAVYEQALARAVRTEGGDSLLAATASLEWGRSLHERQGCAAAKPKIEAAVTVLAADPSQRPTWLPTAFLLAATCRLEAGETEAAAAAARTALAGFPDGSAGEGDNPEIQQARAVLAAAEAARPETPTNTDP